MNLINQAQAARVLQTKFRQTFQQANTILTMMAREAHMEEEVG